MIAHESEPFAGIAFVSQQTGPRPRIKSGQAFISRSARWQFLTPQPVELIVRAVVSRIATHIPRILQASSDRCAVGSNSAAAPQAHGRQRSSTIWRRNCGANANLVLAIVDSLNANGPVSRNRVPSAVPEASGRAQAQRDNQIRAATRWSRICRVCVAVDDPTAREFATLCRAVQRLDEQAGAYLCGNRPDVGVAVPRGGGARHGDRYQRPRAGRD